ncbi:MAG TPA: hypothetical protein VJ396_04140 [Acidiferrobacterales bacterium]|nr:hypothetical protein [Acidiferrobacterales bacterium]
MLPHAEITHNSPGRLRLRIRARRGHADYFAGIEEKLVQCPGIERVVTNPVTGSVLLEPAIDLAALVAFTQAQQLFQLAQTPALMAPLTQQVAEHFADLNGELRRFSGGGIDLGALGFIGMVTLAAVQLQRGHVLGPASTLLWYAAGLLRMPPTGGGNSFDS